MTLASAFHNRPCTADDGLPLIEPLGPAPDTEDLFHRLACRSHCLFLDSAKRDPALGRYSFLAVDPFDYFEIPADGSDALGALAARLAAWSAPSVLGLPPFQGGAAGLFSYDLGRSLEHLPACHVDEFQVPALAIGFYDAIVAVDHLADRSWIISQGFPATGPAERRRRASERIRQLRHWISEPAGDVPRPTVGGLTVAQLAPQFARDGPAGLTSTFSESGYLAAIDRALEYIRAGDVFQVNLAQRLLHPAHDDAAALYVRLRRRNPAPFAGYFDLGAFQIVSASPERFLNVRANEVEARPIKGTRQRAAQPAADRLIGDELLASEKDRAENVMIVDLLRNDLARVCQPDTVRVTQLCQLETYEFVHHLVSAVCGTLQPGRQPLDLLRAAFPGGSISGAPKIRAMQIIAELEPTVRGAYCGALGYVGFDGSLDTSILIRTITAGRGWWQAPVGGGIVAQSVPRREYEETWHKAEGLLRALR